MPNILPKIIYSSFLTFICNSAVCQTYQYYYGNIHAHSGYSDGNVDASTSLRSVPGQDYAYAKQSYNFNFLGISEHNHSGAGMQLADFDRGLYQADTANVNGQFVCMYGMEYGVISNGGHVVVYGIDSLVGWESNNYKIFCSKTDYSQLWSIIAKRPKAFATLAHPQQNDYNNLETSAYRDTADMAIVGTVLRSGAAFSTTNNYSDGPPGTLYMQTYQNLLARGYKLGPTIDHDNHYTTFGRTAHSRTVVLAQALNRDSIMAAYKAMRFYASDDWNTQVNFTINAYPIGSTFSSESAPTLNVTVTDPDAGDDVSSIKVYYGVPGSGVWSTLLTSNSNSNTLNYTHAIPQGDTYYYYLEITQVDGNKIWTSPIWFTRSFSTLASDVITLKGRQVQKSIKIESGFTRRDYASVELQRSFVGYDFTTISNSAGSMIDNAFNLFFIDGTPVSGFQYYRIKCTDLNGRMSYSAVIAVNYQDKSLVLHNIYPNPVYNVLHISISSEKNESIQISIYDEDGRLRKRIKNEVKVGENIINENISALSRGSYRLVINKSNLQLEKMFIKL